MFSSSHRHTPFLIGLMLFLVSLLFAPSFAMSMGALHMSTDRQIGADNLVTGVLAVAALVIRFRCLYRYREQWDNRDKIYHRSGSLFLIVGLILHRPFWTPWRNAREMANITGDASYAEFAQWWETDLAPLTVLGQSFWWLGLIAICYPALRRFWPRQWPVVVISTVAIVWMIGYQLPDIVLLIISAGT